MSSKRKQTQALSRRHRLVVGTTLATSAFLGGYRGYIRRAYADCTGAGGTYTCDGTLTTEQALNGSPLTVTTSPGFSIDVAGAEAFDLSATGGLVFTDANASAITGEQTGIYARNDTSGALAISTTGTVTGSNSEGIYAQGDTGTESVTISTAGSVTGASTGIRGRNSGSGALTITTAGDVRGGFEGIRANNYGTDVTVTTGAGTTVSGEAGWGIDAQHSGTGALSITANGDVIGFGNEASNGIYATGEGTDLTIITAAGTTVSGDGYESYGGGIYARNNGSGVLTITANGDVTGANQHGIYAQQYGTELTITTGTGGTVSGAVYGIVAQQYGSGALSISASGDVIGGLDGIDAHSYGGGAIEITVGATGTVTGNGAGVDDFGIDIVGAPASVVVAGAVNGGAGGAIRFDNFDNRLELRGGAAVNGNVVGGTAADTLALAGTGAGSFDVSQLASFEAGEKSGTSTWTLSGTNTEIGSFTVNEGVLAVNGDLSNAAVAVLGGTLGGAGTVGAVTVADGAHLAPGNSPGTLNVGSLTLGAGSMLDFELGAADVVGGALNDLINVNGDLTLDGTLNVTPAASGSYGAGIYRLINYTGTLTDNGLDLGLMPAGSTNAIQASVANQINLINTQAAVQFSYWDGAGVANNGQVNGGSGTWTASPADQSWTDADGLANGPYADGAMAIFMGAPGTVTVDASQGAVNISAMQFAVDGYRVEGDAVTLLTGLNALRVGDGMASGAGYTATIASELAGPGTLDKTDLGTLVLTGANTYTGGTTITSGTLQLGEGGTSGSIVGDVVNDGTLVFNRADATTFGGAISGSGTLIKENAGTLVMTASSTFTGETQIANGGLEVDGTLPSAIMVAPGATLSGIGTVGGVTTSAGAFVAPGNAATPFGALTIAANYTGGATVQINTELGGSNSPTSRLVVQGGTSGTSPVLVNPTGGAGAMTAGDGIGIIQVNGASPAGSFTLAQPVQAGAYQYLLYQGGASDANDWYLRSQFAGPEPGDDPAPAFRPAIAGYALGHQASLEYGYTSLANLRSRVGSQGRLLDPASNGSSDVWMRASVDEIDVGGAHFSAQDLQMSMLQLGSDLYRSESAQGGAHFGVMVSLGQMSATFFDPQRASAAMSTRGGDVESDVAGVGLYWTLYGGRGGYLDLSAQALNYRNRYEDQYLASGTQRGWGTSLSAEIGAAYALGSSNWKIEPQLQLGYQRLQLDDFQDQVSAIGAVDEDALRARAGVQLFRAASDWLGMRNASPYLALGVQRDFRDAAPIAVGATDIRDEIPATTADAGVGFAGTVGAGFELHLDARYQEATDGEKDGVRANFGFRKRF